MMHHNPLTALRHAFIQLQSAYEKSQFSATRGEALQLIRLGVRDAIEAFELLDAQHERNNIWEQSAGQPKKKMVAALREELAPAKRDKNGHRWDCPMQLGNATWCSCIESTKRKKAKKK